jgi:hypothetical protein
MESPTTSNVSKDLKIERKKHRLEAMKRYSKIMYENKKKDILDKRKVHYQKRKEIILLNKRDHYKERKQEILEKRAEHYKDNKEAIRKKQAIYYIKRKQKIFQRRRFHKHFDKNDALSYLTSPQEHLYHHTNGFCQTESIEFFNHRIESYDSVCKFCTQNSAVKILGVNRLVCTRCNKAQCWICKTEVSPDPRMGHLHYYTRPFSDTGLLLKSIPNYCPLYSNNLLPNSRRIEVNKKAKECRICADVKIKYPEYEVFHKSRTELGIDFEIYICNICTSDTCSYCVRKYFLCEFDHHMRGHTKYGQNIAIVAINSPMQTCVREKVLDHVEKTYFASIEKEIMKASGVSAVLAVYDKRRLGTVFNEDELKNADVGASLVLKIGTDIEAELSSISFDKDVIEKYKVLTVKSYYLENGFEKHRYYGTWRNKFEELLYWQHYRDPLMSVKGFPREEDFHYRNLALMTTRCSLTYPFDTYASVPSSYKCSWYGYLNRMLKYFWEVVKQSDLCCCVSKFYCSSSTTLDKCVEKCCGKCKEENSETDSSCSSLDFDLDTDETVTSESEMESKSNAEMNSSSSGNPNDDSFEFESS